MTTGPHLDGFTFTQVFNNSLRASKSYFKVQGVLELGERAHLAGRGLIQDPNPVEVVEVHPVVLQPGHAAQTVLKRHLFRTKSKTLKTSIKRFKVRFCCFDFKSKRKLVAAVVAQIPTFSADEKN